MDSHVTVTVESMSGNTAVGYDHGDGAAGRPIRYDREPEERPSVAVATALAEHRGEDAATMGTRLYDHVDPEALDALFADRHDGGPRSDGQVRFRVEGATVVVEPDHVRVYASS